MPHPHGLSKSRFTSGLQCHRQLWWRVHEPASPELMPDAARQTVFDNGTRVGEVARGYVPGGVLIDLPYTNYDGKLGATQEALASGVPAIYEASFVADHVFVAVDIDGVLLLDELDAIAKRRDDVTDVGELKRLVTVLLQEIDDWPPTGLLIAATNHSDLLDPAVWRRFELRVDFPMPTNDSVRRAIATFLGTDKIATAWQEVLAVALRGLSFSDIEREVMLARRSAVIRGISLEEALARLVHGRVQPLPRRERGEIALWLTEAGISQRQVHDLTGVSRDTIRKKTRAGTTDTRNEE